MKLIPPNKKLCQAEVPNGINFMTMGGGTVGRVRCKNRPSIILYENKKPKGSMSLCDNCLAVFIKQVGLRGYKIKSIFKENK